jgi:7-cyano-7-deazaguanine synthase
MSKVAVLVSGGMDSSILTVDLANAEYDVYPVYVRHGLHWEAVELDHLQRFLKVVGHPRIKPLKILELPVTDMYEAHWSVSGDNVPDETTPDEAVYLPGRNLLLLAKVGVWCSIHGIKSIALAPLKGNPFSDNTDEFYENMEKIIDMALGWSINVIRPYADKGKDEVIELGKSLPLHLTFSCIQPVKGLHCGHCNKCAERKIAYSRLSLADDTEYFDSGLNSGEKHRV